MDRPSPSSVSREGQAESRRGSEDGRPARRRRRPVGAAQRLDRRAPADAVHPGARLRSSAAAASAEGSKVAAGAPPAAARWRPTPGGSPCLDGVATPDAAKAGRGVDADAQSAPEGSARRAASSRLAATASKSRLGGPNVRDFQGRPPAAVTRSSATEMELAAAACLAVPNSRRAIAESTVSSRPASCPVCEPVATPQTDLDLPSTLSRLAGAAWVAVVPEGPARVAAVKMALGALAASPDQVRPAPGSSLAHQACAANIMCPWVR